MQIDKLTSKFQEALGAAQSLAVGRDHQIIEPAHLLLALLNQQGGTVKPLLAQSGVNVPAYQADLEAQLNRFAQVEGGNGDVRISSDLNRLLNQTDKLAQQRQDQFISSELLVLAAVEDKSQTGELLRKHGANKTNINNVIDKIRGGERVTDQNAEEQRQALEKYTIDLTARAESGKLDPVIGRDDEIRRTIQV
ncbi:MAG TPA: type VI secretion system ATPase TssH, partial [Methylophaga sp.]|nr:type VI secretion system ATPase TssH [Methylophaga sp.]